MADPRYPNLRTPYLSELIYFLTAQEVAGMATPDNRVILNQFNNTANKDAVYANEDYRNFMRNGNQPNFTLTPEQNAFLNQTSYQNAPLQDRQQTIAARQLTGDPTGGRQTFEQNVFVNLLREKKTGLLR